MFRNSRFRNVAVLKFCYPLQLTSIQIKLLQATLLPNSFDSFCKLTITLPPLPFVNTKLVATSSGDTSASLPLTPDKQKINDRIEHYKIYLVHFIKWFTTIFINIKPVTNK